MISAAATARLAEQDLRLRHTRQRRLCQALETIADSLPDAVRPCMLAQARALIADYLALIAHVDEDRQTGRPVIDTGDFDGLARERRKDVFIAEEVAEALTAWSAGASRLAPDAMGYLLRNLFDRLRQQMALEASYLDLLRTEPTDRVH